jgi:hypothetical protein
LVPVVSLIPRPPLLIVNGLDDIVLERFRKELEDSSNRE